MGFSITSAILFIQHLYHSKQLITFSSLTQALAQDNLAESSQMVKPFSSSEGCPTPGLQLVPASRIRTILMPSLIYLPTDLTAKAGGISFCECFF